MASGMYAKAKRKIQSREVGDSPIDLLSDTIRVALVQGTPATPDASAFNTHEFVSDVVSAGNTLNAVRGELGTKSYPNAAGEAGAFDAADTVCSTVAAGSDIVALVLYKFGTGDSDSPVIAWIDGFTPVTPNGGNITVKWAGTPNYIWRI